MQQRQKIISGPALDELYSAARAALHAEVVPCVSLDKTMSDGSYDQDHRRLHCKLAQNCSELERQNQQLISAKHQLEQSKTAYHALFDLAPVGYFQLDRAGLIVQVNKTGGQMLEIDRAVAQHRHFWRFIAVADRKRFRNFIDRVFGTGRRHSCEVRIWRDDGHSFDAHIECLAPGGVSEHLRQCLCAMVDISDLRGVERQLERLTTDLRAANERLDELAHIDPLTGLLNRRGLERVLFNEVSHARRTGALPFALFADCDNFKRINDTLGHAVGNEVLRQIAERLEKALRPTDKIARVGGDEFLILLPDTTPAAGLHVAERMRSAVSERPLRVTPPVSVTLSIGAVSIPLEKMSIEDILAKAHLPLRRSKQQGKDRLSTDEYSIVGQSDSGPSPRSSQQRVMDFEGAVTDVQQLGLYSVAQPIRALADQRVVALELLSRSPLPGLELPEALFRLAMQRGVLVDLDLACLRNCLSQINERRNRVFHLNLFPSTLLQTPPERLLALFNDIVDLSKICIEISEQQVIGDPAELQRPLAQLTSAGLRFAMDNLGCGKNSLETLILLEPDVVKINRRLITGAARDRGRQRSLARLTRMLAALEVFVVAEGVESADDVKLLADLGVSAGQGFYLGSPARELAPKATGPHAQLSDSALS
jgi:diguanylate cyclase (GGDEF)-like protein/PAS domain S-box-containing protein